MPRPHAENRLILTFLLAAILPVLSFASPFLVKELNESLGRNLHSDLGWWMYALVRLVLFLALVWSIVRLREEPATARSQRAAGNRGDGARFDPLMGLRALAATMVLFGHHFLVVYSPVHSPSRAARLMYDLVRSNPWAGVWTFFTLSGYLMGKGFFSGRYAVTESGVKAFYRNRYLRIVPLYFAGVLLMSIFSTPAILMPRNGWQLILISVFDYAGDLPNNPIGALWSVSTEVQFYFLCPFLFLAIRAAYQRLGKAFVLAPITLAVMLTAVRTIAFHHYGTAEVAGFSAWNRLVYTPLLCNLDIFVMGMSLSFLETQWGKRSKGQLSFGLIALPACLYLFATAVGMPVLSSPAAYAAVQWFTVFCSGAYILMAHQRGKIAMDARLPSLALRGIERIGVLTYAIYVFHSNIMSALRPLLPAGQLRYAQTFGMFPVIALLVWVVAHFFYEMVEKPYEQRKRVPGTPLTDAP